MPTIQLHGALATKLKHASANVVSAPTTGHQKGMRQGKHIRGHVEEDVYSVLQIESKEKSLMRGKAEIQSLVSQLRIQPASTITEGAHRLYGLALGKNFTRGRRTAQVWPCRLDVPLNHRV